MDKQLFGLIGLDEKEAKIYMASLVLGTASVGTLAQKSGLKRPTVYLYVDELLKKGILAKVPIGKRTYYRPVDASLLLERAGRNIEKLRKSLPEMLEVSSERKPTTQILEGREGVERVYGEVAKANSFRIWSNIAAVEDIFHHVSHALADEVQKRGINVREIIADTREARHSAKAVSLRAGPTYSARVATTEGLENDTIIYADRVAFFHLYELDLFVVKIENASIADSLRAMFDMAWKSAKPFVPK